MLFQNRPPSKIEESDLLDLIENEISEGKTLEYKLQIDTSSDKGKINFIAAVSSLTNAIGGYLIIGIHHVNGIAKKLEGIEIDNTDEKILQIEQIIRDSTDPPITQLSTHCLKLSNGKFAIIIQIPRSWISPHRVIYKGHDKFYSRSSAGKYPMDVNELRQSFLLTETIIERVRIFREKRLDKIRGDIELPVTLKSPPPDIVKRPKLVLHIVPISAFFTSYQIDINSVRKRYKELGNYFRYNLDGIVISTGADRDKIKEYFLLYRSGIFEVVNNDLFNFTDNGNQIFGDSFELRVVQNTIKIFDMYHELNIKPPHYIFLSILNVNKFTMISRQGYSSLMLLDDYGNPIDRNDLILSEIEITAYPEDDNKLAGELKPLIDSVWNACGFSESQYFVNVTKWRWG